MECSEVALKIKVLYTTPKHEKYPCNIKIWFNILKKLHIYV